MLLRMPAEEHERLRALYRRQAVEGARDPRGGVEGARNAGGERHEGRVHPAATGQGALPSSRPPSPATTSATTPLATVEASGYRFGALGCRWSGGVLRCTVAIENLEPEPRRLRVYGTGIRCAGSAVIDEGGSKHCPVVSIGNVAFTPYVAADAFLPGVPLNIHLEARGRRPEGDRVAVVLALFREGERQTGRELVTLQGIPLGGTP